jgi:AP-1 complex subunit beta-1
MEKLEIIIRLANERNVEQVLLEFKEYATEVDVDFVRKSVRAIGRCAIKLERAAERCITVLLELIQTGVNYVVQEAVIVIKDIFRRYPNRYESIIATLCENLDTLDEPEAKASMIWIIGEYAERIENADELLESFLETFQDETAQVQLQLLTATVKLFLKNPEGTQDMVQRVLSLATEESDNPDLRDRGYVYWRLLVANPDAARAVVLAEKPTIADDTFSLESSLLDELMKQIATLASVYHKPPEAFVVRALPAASGEEEEDIIEEYFDEEGEESSAFSGEHEESKRSADGGRVAAPATNLLDLGFDEEPTSAFSSTASTPAVRKQLVVPAESGNGVAVSAAVARQGGQVQLLMDFTNQTPTPMQQFAIQLNTSTFGLAPVSQAINLPAPIANGSTQSTAVPLAFNPQMVNPSSPQPLQLQAAIKNVATGHVFYFMAPFQLDALFAADGAMDVNSLVAAWRSIDESLEATQVVNDLPSAEIEVIKQKLAAVNVHFVAQRPVPQQEGQTVVFCSAKTLNNVQFIFELTFRAGFNACKLVVKSPDQRMSELAKQCAARVITA